MSKLILANDGMDDLGKELLEKAGFTVVTEKVAQENLINEINQKNYVALTVRSATKVRKDIIDACPNLKVIARGGVGMDNIDVEYALSKGIKVINTPAASSNSVAELVFAHLYSAARFLYDSNRQMPANGNTKFDELKKKYSKGIELTGKTIGIIGFGRIGKEVARIALGSGMKVVAYDPHHKDTDITVKIYGTEGVKVHIHAVDMDELLAKSDFITAHVPSGEMLGAKQFEQMKKGVILVNAARGGVINEKDLIAALDSGRIAHACLDVFTNEPTPDSALLNHPKISLTPHIGAATNEAQERIGVELATRLIDTLSVEKAHK